jgi:hypothetical protein
VYALAAGDVPPCAVIVAGLVGTDQLSFTADFPGAAEAAKLGAARTTTTTTGAAGADSVAQAPTSSFDPVYVATATARLALLEVFNVRTTLLPAQAAGPAGLRPSVALDLQVAATAAALQAVLAHEHDIAAAGGTIA